MNKYYYESLKETVKDILASADEGTWEEIKTAAEYGTTWETAQIIQDYAEENDATGNITGSWTCNAARSKRNLQRINNKEEIKEAFECFDMREQFAEWTWNEEYEKIEIIYLEYILPVICEDIAREIYNDIRD